MIDFRYHLVSLISVFLALAVGIVLGAGPLRESIGDTLTEQVNQLRQSRDALRAEVATKSAAVEHRDGFVLRATPALVAGQLAGRSVAVVRLPGVEDAAVDAAADALAAAGASVAGRVEITDTWVDPERTSFREELANRLQGSVPEGETLPDSGDRLASVLARAVVAPGPPGVQRPDAPATTLINGLTEAGLVKLDGDLAGRADAAVVLAPGIADPAGGQATPAAASEGALTAFTALARALDAGSEGAVVTGPASSAARGGLVAAVRGDDAANAAVSTVDTGATPMGDVTSVLALREQLAGGVGRYGFGDGATEPLPARAAPAPAPTTPASPKATP